MAGKTKDFITAGLPEDLRDRVDYNSDCVLYTADRPWKLNIPETAKWLIENYPVKTILENKDMLYYYEGAYRPYGEQYIETILNQQFGDMLNDKCNPILNSTAESSILNRIRIGTYRHAADFDNNIDLINMDNGLYNWRTQKLEPHTSEYASMIQIPTLYDPNAECHAINEMLSKVLTGKNIKKIKEFAGYCLYRGYPIQKAFMLYGPGGSYKSTTASIIQAMLGDENCSSVAFQQIGGLYPDKFASADLYGKMMNFCGDLDNQPIYYTGVFKSLTSGMDRVRAEFKHINSFNYINYAKIIFATNEIPVIHDRTTGLTRRFEVIIMNHTELLDDDLLMRIRQPEELSGFFNECVSLLPDLLDRGDFTAAMSLDKIEDILRSAANPAESFIDKCIEEKHDEYISKDALYELYKKYCVRYNAVPESNIKFGKKLVDHMGWRGRKNNNAEQKSYKGNMCWCWMDIRVVDPDFIFSTN